MDKSVRVKNILFQIKQLDCEARLFLLENMIQQLRKNKDDVKPTQRYYLTELNSLGSEIWKDVDIDHYVQKERQWD